MTKLIAVLELLERRYANEHALFVLSEHEGRLPLWMRPGDVFAAKGVLLAKRDLCREIRVELQADAMALGGGTDVR